MRFPWPLSVGKVIGSGWIFMSEDQWPYGGPGSPGLPVAIASILLSSEIYGGGPQGRNPAESIIVRTITDPDKI